MKKTLAATLLCALLLCLCACGNNATHVHEYASSRVEPGCESGGYTVYRCKCGDEYSSDFTDPLGHENVLLSRTEPTCTESGKVSYMCLRCGKPLVQTIPATGHDISNPSYFLISGKNETRYYAGGTCRTCGKTVREQICTVGFGVVAGAEDTVPAVPGEGGKIEVKTKDERTLSLKAIPGKYLEFLGWSDGSVKPERNYDIKGGDIYALFAYKGELPVISVVTENGAGVYNRDEYSKCTISVIGSDGYDFTGAAAGMRVRGNASSMYGDIEWIKKNKVHYRIKFEERTPMLGLNGGAECKSWVLLRGDGNYLRELAPFYLFRNLCDKEVFCPDVTYAKLFVNGEFMGVYEVCDQVQIDKYRIDIPELKDGDTSMDAGFLMELENYPQTASHYFGLSFDNVRLTDMYGVSHAARYVNVSVKYDELTNEQVKTLEKYLNNVYRIVYNAIFKNKYYKLNAALDVVEAPEFTSAGECISNVLDLDAAAAMYIVEELAMDKDVGVGSFFMYADLSLESPVLTFCAPWDLSWAFDTSYGFDTEHFWVSAWQPQEFINYAGNRSSTWYITLYQCEEFREIVKEKWRRIRSDGTFDTMLEMLPVFSQSNPEDIAAERMRWGGGNPVTSAQTMANFLKKRAAWLDTQWG